MNELTLFLKDKEILSINVNQSTERSSYLIKLSELERSLKQPIALIEMKDFPFFDTSISKKSRFY